MPDEPKPGDGGLNQPAKRGRPRKDAASSGSLSGSEKPTGGNAEPVERVERINGHAVTDPLDLPEPVPGAEDLGNDRPRNRRTRKTRTDEIEETVQNLASLLKSERLLVTGCFFLGNSAQAPELHITEAEASEIGEALKDLSKHYPIGMSEKAIAWVNFSFAVGGVFGPKIVAISRRPKRPGPQRVVDISTKAAPAQPTPPASAAMASSPINGTAAATKATTPSQMWNQPGDIEDTE